MKSDMQTAVGRRQTTDDRGKNEWTGKHGDKEGVTNRINVKTATGKRATRPKAATTTAVAVVR